MMKKVISAALAFGFVLAQGASAQACVGERDPLISRCFDGVVGGEMTNAFQVLVDLAIGDIALGSAFDASGDEIFECATFDREEGLGNFEQGSVLICPTPVEEIQIEVL